MLTIVPARRKVSASQRPYFTTLSVHSRGELLFVLADGWHRLGNREKTRRYLLKLVEINKRADCAETAQTRLANPQPTVATCLGCHKG